LIYALIFAPKICCINELSFSIPNRNREIPVMKRKNPLIIVLRGFEDSKGLRYPASVRDIFIECQKDDRGIVFV